MERRALDLDGLAALPANDPRLAALEPHERAQLAAFREFLREPTDVPAGQLADADRRLGEALDEAMGLGAGSRSPRVAAAPSLGERLAGWFTPAARPVWVMAAVLVVAGALWFSQTRLGEPVMRGSEGAGLLVESRASASGIELSWEASAPGDHYEVRVFGPELLEIARLDAGDLTRFTLSRSMLGEQAPGDGRVSYQVVALRDEDEVARSRTAALTLP